MDEGRRHVVGDENGDASVQGTFRVYPLPANPADPMPKRRLGHVPPSGTEDVLIQLYVIW